ncbi:hydroxypyruvate isomerase family protein [Acuticoccus mangrovi]|uniref:TIM barrel protein n=1 Tax=Acuticoccus mangrovi TaxID=2796142 RepID=A0A934MD77_9HYPH|nr:TIM barrel protein [Acuticoccus mangrovi]MBJ3776052.1 TIM barrel protein [Acuticoccus mangrovi]
MSYAFSANLGFLWKELPFLERIAAAKAAGFALVEFHDDAQRTDLDAVREALGGTPVVGINIRMGDTNGTAALAGKEDTARTDIGAAVTVARALGGAAVHVLSGRTDDPAGTQRLIARLDEAAGLAPDITFLVEPISPQAIPGYFLSTVEQAADILQQVGRENVKIMFDCFHVQRASGDVLARFHTHLPLIGHVQIAGGLTRAEPDRGELNYPFLLPAFQDAGYTGAFGCEYWPEGTVEEGLGWRDAFL